MRRSMTMMFSVLVGLAILGGTQVAQATPIVGTITIGDDWAPTGGGGGLLTATGVHPIANIAHTVGFGSGAFTGIPGTPVAYKDFTFNPSTAIVALWSVSIFSFDLISSHVDFQSASFLNLSGVGTLHALAGFGYDDTPGVWSFAGSTTGHGTFSFADTTTNLVRTPEPASLVLLGAGLISAAFLRKRQNRK